MTVSLPEHRVFKIVTACRLLINKSHARIREVARVIGLLVAAFPAVELGKLHYRQLEKEKIAALQKGYGDFELLMPITDAMKADLHWWLDNVTTQVRRIFHSGTEVDLYTDASNLGWGGHLHQRSTSGGWSEDERLLHINALELKAILFALQAFGLELYGKHVRVFCDNTTALSYVNEMGGMKSDACNEIAIQIWDWCVTNGAWVTCSHIPSKENTAADTASRLVNDRHEWQLNVHIFRQLCDIFGTPVIDLFASRLNTQVPMFCSWRPDPGAAFFDAFSLNWAQFELAYIFPPFALITRCLQKLRADEARAWVVLPLWMSQPWMGQLLRLLVAPPRLIMMRKGVLSHPSYKGEHPVMAHTQLIACLLSGIYSEHEAFLRRVRRSSWPHGNQVQQNNTSRISPDGHNFVLDGTSIPLLPLYQI